MMADVYPLQVLLMTLAGWVNRHQQHVIEYLVAENRVLKGQLTGRRLRLTDDERRRLAAKGRRLGRRLLRQVDKRRNADGQRRRLAAEAPATAPGAGTGPAAEIAPPCAMTKKLLALYGLKVESLRPGPAKRGSGARNCCPSAAVSAPALSWSTPVPRSSWPASSTR